MSRIAVVSVLIAYLIAALAFGVFMEMQKPFPSLPAVTVGTIGGTAIAAYVISAILPLIIWAFYRFRLQSARGPMVLWACLGIVSFYLMYVGTQSSQEREIERNFSSADRTQSALTMKKSCVESQTKTAISRNDNINIQQINAYCGCYAASLSQIITSEETVYVAKNGTAPPSLQQKINQAFAGCSAAAR